MKSLWYVCAAVGMGIVWYVVLLPVGDAVPLGGKGWLVNLVAMCLASLSVALLFRAFIVRAKGWLFHVLAVGLPTVGALLFGVYYVLGWHLDTLAQLGVGTDWDYIVKTPLVFVWFAWVFLPITVPMGYLSQWVMQCVGQNCRARHSS